MATDWNQAIIEEFRATGGKVGGRFEGGPLLLLHTVGAKSGKTRVNPMMYQVVDGGLAVFASKGGAPTNPDWYHNLLANPRATVELGTETFVVIARVAEGGERERIWATQKQRYPGFADYERKTPRVIPVIILERVSRGRPPRQPNSSVPNGVGGPVGSRETIHGSTLGGLAAEPEGFAFPSNRRTGSPRFLQR